MLFRPATINDIPAIKEISKGMWEGNDYLPFFIERWLKEGGVFVGEVDGRVIGVSRIARFGEQEWWLEGLRIAADEQGKGYGRILHDATIAEVERIGKGVIRYATGNTNRSARMGEHSGFDVILSLSNLMYELPESEETSYPDDLLAKNSIRLVGPTEPGILEYLLEGCHKHYQGLLCQGWEFPEVSPQRLTSTVDQGCLLVSGAVSKPEAAVLLLINDQRPSETVISIMHGDEQVIATRILPCLPLAAKAFNPVSKNLGKGHPLEYAGILTEFGFKSSLRSVYLQVFEKRIQQDDNS